MATRTKKNGNENFTRLLWGQLNIPCTMLKTQSLKIVLNFVQQFDNHDNFSDNQSGEKRQLTQSVTEITYHFVILLVYVSYGTTARTRY